MGIVSIFESFLTALTAWLENLFNVITDAFGQIGF